MERYTISKGSPLPFGASLKNNTANFAVFCDAPTLTLCLFSEDQYPFYEIHLDPKAHKTGKIWHIAINNLPIPICYGYKTNPEGPLLLDPYALQTSASQIWRQGSNFLLGKLSSPHLFDWENDQPLNIPGNKLIIYEMHVRGFTQDPSSQVRHPGTFLGLIEKIPYLKNLGINAIELLPIQEFNENECIQYNPKTEQRLCNYWGYSTLNFFSIMNRYTSNHDPITEFKMLIRELHKNGIEVILDIVFNHTGEGNEQGPVCSFKGFANSIYYMFNAPEEYLNYSGCGNTVSCNEPVVLQMILDCLRYWVIEMHVDGFRFDLAAIFSRSRSGSVLPFSPLIEAISLDPVLSGTKLIAEPWDAAGLYQLGNIFPQVQRWSEWNDRYRDTIRSFIKGSPGTKPEFATAICGSQDVFAQRVPASSLNFITAHDGFTLADLVSYNHKHNENNGENNRDGHSFNESWNCGVEGPTTDPDILILREQQMRNFHVALMISQGIPMVHMGDEYGHTKFGNNNTWCQDNELSWFLWENLGKNKGFYRFYKLMIAFRRKHSQFQHATFLTPQDIDWFSQEGTSPIWDDQNSFLAFKLKGSGNSIYVAFNAHNDEKTVHLPPDPWFRVVDTSKAAPDDFCEHPDPLHDTIYKMQRHSAIILITK